MVSMSEFTYEQYLIREARREARLRRKKQTAIISATVLVITIIALGTLTVVKLAEIMKVQQDIMDTVTSIEVEVLTDEKDQTVNESSSLRLTPEERELVCRVVAAEARGEGLQGMMAVSQVIYDRAVLWEMTPAEVVTAPDQFAAPYQGELTDDIYLAVANVFDGGMRVIQEPVTHFYSGPEPYWASSKESRGSIGRHRFMY